VDSVRRLVVISAVVISMVLIWGLSWHEDNWAGKTMGTSYSVHIFRPGFLQSSAEISSADMPDTEIPETMELQKVLEEDLARVNQSMSTYIPDSEISKFNQIAAGDTCHPVSQDFMNVLTIAEKVYQDTDGYFDPTVGPLVDLWGFGGKSKLTLDWAPPSEDAIAETMKKVGFNSLELHKEDLCVIKRADVEVDLSAVAKGYGVDVLLNTLNKAGIANALVEIGGEVHVSGQKMPLRPWMKGAPWRIMIEKPSKDMVSIPVMTDALKEEINAPFSLKDQAVATSGNYRNYYEYKGQSFSHIINPKTGYPLEHQHDKSQLTSVSIFADSTGIADGYATGLFVLGLEAAQDVAIRQGLEVVLVYEDQSTKSFDVWVSPAYKKGVSKTRSHVES